MDIFTIAQTIWRHKLVTVPISLLIVVGATYVFMFAPTTYKAAGSVLIVNPPSAPTPAQIAADPSLKTANTNNPYASTGYLPAVADVVINIVQGDHAQQQLLAAGMNPQSTIALGGNFVGPAPILQVTGVGKTPAEAIKSCGLLTKEAVDTLHDIQVAQNVNPFYLIKGITLVQPTSATTAVSGKLRSLIGVVAGGIIVMFIGISMAEAMNKRGITLRRRKRPGNSIPEPSADDSPRDRERPGRPQETVLDLREDSRVFNEDRHGWSGQEPAPHRRPAYPEPESYRRPPQADPEPYRHPQQAEYDRRR
jgi:hypothetical protein